MQIQFMGRQMDYVVFVYGLSFIMLSLIGLILIQEKNQKVPWIYLVLFGLVQSLKNWIDCVTFSFHTQIDIGIILLVLTFLSFLFLFEFGRIGYKLLNGHGLTIWIHIPLILCSCVGGFWGKAELDTSIRFIYGLLGCVLTAIVLYQLAKAEKSRYLIFSAITMVVYAFLVGLVVPTSTIISKVILYHDTFITIGGFPFQIFEIVSVLIISFCIYKYDQLKRQKVLTEHLGESKNYFELQFFLLFAILVISGWGIIEYSGNLAESSLRQDILNQVNLSKSSVNSQQLSKLRGDQSDLHLPDYISLRQKLIDIKSSDARLRDLYLMTIKEGNIIFVVDGLPLEDPNYTNPGVFYKDPPLLLFDVFFSGQTRIIGPYTDEFGSFVSGFSSIRDESSNKIIGVLGIDIDAEDFQLMINRNRLLAMAVNFLLFLIFIGFFVFRQKSWESSQRIVISERSLAQAQTVARMGSWTWNVLSNHLIWSEEMYVLFGEVNTSTVHTYENFRQYFLTKDWDDFDVCMKKAVQEKTDFEFEAQIQRPDHQLRLMINRGTIRYGTDGNPIQVLGITQDISDRKFADQNIRKLSRAIEQSPVSVVITNVEGIIEYVNPKFTSLTGYTLDEAKGQNPRILKTGDTSPQEYKTLWTTIFSGGEWQGEFHNKKKNGDLYWESAVISPIFDENHEITHFVAVKEDITERKQANEEILRAHKELEITNQELEQASKVKSQFLANMSHEIRTPLNAIIGMTGLLLDTPMTQEQQNYAETVRNSGEVLLTLINDILDFSKIEAQKMELENQPFDLRHCIEGALDLIASKASEKKIELAYLIENELPPFMIGDVTRLRQILVNLLSNAVKFTEKGEVVISVNGQLRDHHQYSLHFSVRDTGIGIPPERLNRLFQSFSQVDASTTRKYGGTGLGLVISKRLSEMMGGMMWVESSGVPGQGSTFHFTILIKEALDQKPVDQEVNNIDLAGMKILIVDDNKTNCEILRRYMEMWGMTPVIVGSGYEALQILKDGHQYNMAILDMQMPEMDGIALAKEIHVQLQTNVFPLILLSSLGYHERGGEESLFAACLTKPIKPSQLFDALGIALNKKSPVTRTKYNGSVVVFDENMGHLHPLHILVVDDNTVNQNVALSLLKRLGYRADIASNGHEAIEAVRRQYYDVVFMDGQMPEMDGEEATRQIRANIDIPEQPRIIAMTANAMQGDRERYLSCGMDDYISKPIRVDDLVRALKDSPSQSEPIMNGETRVHHNANTKMLVNVPAIDEASDLSSMEGQEPEPLNMAVLNDFRDLMGVNGSDMVENLANLYIQDSLVLIEKISDTISTGDKENLRLAAHTLKGNSFQIGASPLAEMCAELERIAKSNSLIGADSLLIKVQSEFQRVKSKLQLAVNPSA
jgi:PAS domain S-box-containing protein